MNIKDKQILKWYQKTGWILLVSVLFLVIVLGVAFGLLTLNFWWQIKQGKGDELYGRLYKSTLNVKQDSLKDIRDRLETVNEPFLGNPKSDFVIVEFVDFKCPVCKEFSSTIHRINNSFGDKVKIIIKDFPLESIHTDTSKLSHFANCANAQDKYWEAHDLLFLIQDEIPENVSDEYLYELSDRLNLNKTEFTKCIKDTEVIFEVMNDFSDGTASGVKGTPTFFVNGERIEGLIPWESWKKYLEKI